MSNTHPANSLENASQTATANIATLNADIVAIKAKTDKITITSNLDLNQISSQSSVNAATASTHTTQLAMGTSSGMKSAIDNNTTARTTNATDIASNLSTINGHTIAINANILGRTTNTTNIATNTASITTLNNAFPKETNIRQYALVSGDIYNDGTVKFYWNAANKQLMFWVLNIPSTKYMVGGVERWLLTGISRTANYISQSNSTYYHYFTGPQLSGAVLNTSFNLTSSYARAVYFLTPFNLSDFPSYEIKVLVGYSAGYHTINIKRFN